MSRRGSSGLGSRDAVCVALALLVSTGLAAGVVPTTQSLGVDQTRATSSVDRMLVESHRLDYAGSELTGMTVTVNNTGSELTADISVSVSRKNGSRLEQQTKMGVVFAQGTTTVTFSFDGQYGHGEFARVDLRVAPSL